MNFSKNMKKFGKNLRRFWASSGVKVWQSCRFRKSLTLQNEYLDAKIGVDTAENEPSKVWWVGWKIWEMFGVDTTENRLRQVCLSTCSSCRSLNPSCGRYPYMKIKSLGGVKIKWLVLLCIEADFCIQIRILQHFSRSTRFAILRTAANWIFMICFFHIFNIFAIFCWKSTQIADFSAKNERNFAGISRNVR